MIISANIEPLSQNNIQIPPWLRAPLFLSIGTVYFSVLQNNPITPVFVELINTTIPPIHWPDLWRIEIETEDTPGNAALIIDLIVQRGLSILQFESTVTTFTRRHATTVIASGRHYESDRDLTYRERISEPSFHLKELEEELIIYLWDQFAINVEGSPRVKIRRMKTYKQLSHDVTNGDRFLLSRDGRPFDGEAVTLSPRAMKHLERTLGSIHFAYTAAVDTKDRILTTTIFPIDRPLVRHLQIVFRADQQGPLTWAYHKLYELGANIIKSQIRPCPSTTVLELRKFAKYTGSNADFVDEFFQKADITVDFARLGGGGLDVHSRLAEFQTDFLSQPFYDKYSAFVRRVSWK